MCSRGQASQGASFLSVVQPGIAVDLAAVKVQTFKAGQFPQVSKPGAGDLGILKARIWSRGMPQEAAPIRGVSGTGIPKKKPRDEVSSRDHLDRSAGPLRAGDSGFSVFRIYRPVKSIDGLA